MQSNQNSPLPPASQFHQNPAFWLNFLVFMQFLLFIHLWAARQLLTCSTNHHLRWLARPLRLLLGGRHASRMLYDLCRPQKNMLLRLRQLPKFSKPYAIASQATLAMGILLSTLRRTNVARLLVAKSWLSLLLLMKRWQYSCFFLKHCWCQVCH